MMNQFIFVNFLHLRKKEADHLPTSELCDRTLRMFHVPNLAWLRIRKEKVWSVEIHTLVVSWNNERNWKSMFGSYSLWVWLYRRVLTVWRIKTTLLQIYLINCIYWGCIWSNWKASQLRKTGRRRRFYFFWSDFKRFNIRLIRIDI